MSRKVDIEEVRRKLLEMGNELLEDKYINAKTPMRYRCLKHGIEHYGKWSDIKQGKACCPKCKKEKISKAHKLDYNYVKDYIENLGYILKSKQYNKSSEKLQIECKIHGLFLMNWDSIHGGQRCPKCSREKLSESQKLSFDFVKAEFEKRGYTLLEDEYINCEHLMRYICNKHPDKIRTIKYNNLRNGKGCKDCATEKVSGKNSHFWKGGVTPESKRARNITEYQKWRDAVYQRDDYTCQKCGKRGEDLNAHHILNFSEYKELRYDVNNGITLCRECHLEGENSFHSIYGKTNNTKEQLEEFLGRRITFEDRSDYYGKYVS